jgi:signal transduction histidine kinase
MKNEREKLLKELEIDRENVNTYSEPLVAINEKTMRITMPNALFLVLIHHLTGIVLTENLVRGKSIFKILPILAELKNDFEKVRDGAEKEIIVNRYFGKMFLKIIIRKFRTAKRNFITLMMIDKSAKIELERQKDENTQLQEMFLSLLAHDIKTPFSNAAGMLDAWIDIHNPEQTEGISLQKTSQQLVGGIKTIDRTLELLKYNSSVSSFPREPVNISAVMLELESEFQNKVDAKSVVLRNGVERGSFAFGNKSIVTSILKNLIDNAIKFSNPRGTVFIFAIQKENTLEIGINDKGIGIPKKYLDSMFSYNNEVKRRGTNQESGSGMALTVIKKILIKMGGDIQVESEEGKGSTFYLYLPTI